MKGRKDDRSSCFRQLWIFCRVERQNSFEGKVRAKSGTTPCRRRRYNHSHSRRRRYSHSHSHSRRPRRSHPSRCNRRMLSFFKFYFLAIVPNGIMMHQQRRSTDHLSGISRYFSSTLLRILLYFLPFGSQCLSNVLYTLEV